MESPVTASADFRFHDAIFLFTHQTYAILVLRNAKYWPARRPSERTLAAEVLRRRTKWGHASKVTE